MDQAKTGRLIAHLRKQHGLTQEALGERLGVTNKTISRWENGNYMPDIGILQLLSKELDVSINELLAGELLSDEDFRKKADDNVVSVSGSSVFSAEEETAFLKKKWRREHIGLLVLPVISVIAAAVLSYFGKPWIAGLAVLAAIIAYGYQNNRMMIYVEHHLYD